MPTSDEILQGLLSTSYKMDEGGVSALKKTDGSWNDDALEALTKIDQARVTALRGDMEKQLGDRYSRGKREAMEALEKQVRDEFGIKDTDAQGLELVKHIVAAKAKALETVPDERIKASPLYMKLETELRDLPARHAEDLKKREEALRAEFTTHAHTREAIARAKAIFKGMNPILPQNQQVADAQMTLLDNYINGVPLQFITNDRGELVDIIPLKADKSEPLRDAHGHPVKYEDLVKTGAARFFEFAKGEPKGGAPDPNGTGNGTGSGDGGQGGGDAFNPKSEREYAEMHAKIRRETSDLAERRKRLDALKEAGVRNGVVS